MPITPKIFILNWKKIAKILHLVEIRIFYDFLSEHPLQHNQANGRMGLVTSFQAFACVASVVVLTGLVFAASSILSKER